MQNTDNLLTSFETKEIKFAKGFDEAIMGFDEESKKVIYSVKKMILMLKKEGYKVEDITEHLYYDLLIKDECVWHYDIAEGI
jgi:hypothetical protein